MPDNTLPIRYIVLTQCCVASYIAIAGAYTAYILLLNVPSLIAFQWHGYGRTLFVPSRFVHCGCKCTVYSVQCTVYVDQCTVYSMLSSKSMFSAYLQEIISRRLKLIRTNPNKRPAVVHETAVTRCLCKID